MARSVAGTRNNVRPLVGTVAPGRVSAAQLTLAAAVGLTLIALGLRLYQIGNESLWLDEGYTLLFSRLPVDRLFVVGGAHEHPPLYYLLVHFLLMARDSPLVPRVVSAVSGALSVLFLFWLGTRLFGRVAGLAAALLLAVSPFHLWYSQDGRAYELAGLLVLLSYLLVFAAVDRPRRLAWVLYPVSLALAVYTDYMTVLALLPQVLLILRARSVGLGRPLCLAWLGAAVAFLPWFATAFLNFASIASNYWIPPPTAAGVTGTVLEFLGLTRPCAGSPCPGSVIPLPFVSGNELILALGTGLAAVSLLVAAAWRRSLNVLLLTLWLILPFALVLLIATKRSLFLDRVFLDATFPLYLLLGGAIAPLLRRPSKLSLLALAPLGLALTGAGNMSLVYGQPSNPDWKSPARDLTSAYRKGQAVVFNPGVLRTVLKAYLPPGWHATRELPLWYRTYLDVPGWQKRYSSLEDSYLRQRNLDLETRYSRMDANLRDRELSEATEHRRQVWLVTEDYSGLNDTRRWFLTHGFQPVLSEIYYGDTRLELWDRLPPKDFGTPVLRDNGFGVTWSRSGRTILARGTATQEAPASLTSSFRISSGLAYSVNVEYRALPGSQPWIAVQAFDRSGTPLGSVTDRFGTRSTSFPRTEWYDLPAKDVWLQQPFGFVAPRGAVRATLTLRTLSGSTSWRHVGVYGGG